VFPVDDIGLQKGGGAALSRWRAHAGRASCARSAKRWAPYRSVATWYLWRSLDPIPVEY
jgi:DNA-3-methyladenine glycosylase II